MNSSNRARTLRGRIYHSLTDCVQVSMAFWGSINPPHYYIMKSLKDGVDIGLIPDIENHLPPEGINRPNMPCTTKAQEMARWAKIAELARRFIIGKRMTRARINLGIII